MSHIIGRKAVILVVMLGVLFARSQVGLAQNPASTTPISDFPLPPPTFDRMIATVDLVIYGTVTRTGEPQHRQTSHGHDYVVRFPSVKVREVLANRSNVKDKTILIRQV